MQAKRNRKRVITDIFDDLFRQSLRKNFSESTGNFIESAHTHWCRFGDLSRKQLIVLGRIRNNNLPEQTINAWE